MAETIEEVTVGPVSWEFITAGDAIFTVELPDGFNNGDGPRHYTYRVSKSQDGRVYFVKCLKGSDNTKDYAYLGLMNNNDGSVRTTGKSKFKADSFAVRLVDRVLIAIACGDTSKIVASGFVLHHEGRCGRCGRLLTTPESVQRGIGPICVDLMNQ